MTPYRLEPVHKCSVFKYVRLPWHLHMCPGTGGDWWVDQWVLRREFPGPGFVRINCKPRMLGIPAIKFEHKIYSHRKTLVAKKLENLRQIKMWNWNRKYTSVPTDQHLRHLLNTFLGGSRQSTTATEDVTAENPLVCQMGTRRRTKHRDQYVDMGFWLVGSIKLYVSFAKEPSKKDDILQKRPVF